MTDARAEFEEVARNLLRDRQEDAIRILLDGLNVAGIAELRELVDYARACAEVGLVPDTPVIVSENGRYAVDLARREARVDDVKVRLARREFDVLAYLMRHRGQAVSYERLLETVFGYPPTDSRNVVRVCIVRLRKAGFPIQTVHRVGYRFTPGPGRVFQRVRSRSAATAPVSTGEQTS